ncbi:xanthine dehydrogenase small subunit [Nitrospirillum amazonense]|uniref:Xanthine dehydrogenase small subunit n=1 Tax=Nitrospirillum amazonense TaxID=28077 RepID=A0A560JE83_9PROT|nr:xanthine dehydrogenase small subunit [Nitrospirillum amazonense]MDG3440004.1 xanthine dehydrogenase small subunit [Nitrospirillum amazonense]TWB68819.1 xanthine dehydrogenase small subunit [Nitrospirillum amazonense]
MAHRTTIRFLLGNEPRTLTDVDPTLTVLDWLRGTERRMGTKEGCAEGDCGACTVVVGRLVDGAVKYEAINACIRFLATLDGCQLLTVEHLKRPDGALHPVQQAMVDCHGSQCGFCTPGFVMSLYALNRAEAAPLEGVLDEQCIDDALAGNLCRCTGYAPIVAAAQQVRNRTPDHIDDALPSVTRALAALADDAVVETGRDGRRFLAPATVDQLADLVLSNPDATIVSGATDVGLWVTKHQRVLSTVIYTGRVAGLARITDRGDALELGAGVTFTAAKAALGRLHPDLDELLRRVGAEQVRNAGTIGGNIANGSPIGDTPPALIALGASLTLRWGAQRRTLPLQDYFLAYGKQDRQPGEFVESVTVPKPGKGDLFAAYKISKRFDQDISALCACFLVTVGDDGLVTRARLAYGGMAGTPKRADAAEAALLGRPWDAAAARDAKAALAQDFTPLSDWRASAAYRLAVAGNLLLKFQAESVADAPATRVLAQRTQGRPAGCDIAKAVPHA